MDRPIPLARIPIDAAVEEAALRALRSGKYILGPECEAFEAELAAHAGARCAVLSGSWTMAVWLLHEAQGLEPGSEVLVPSHTAFPTIEPMLHRGVRPVFVDVNEFGVMDLDHAEALATPRTVGLLPVHLYGHPVELDRAVSLARKHGWWLLEDCAQAHGAAYQGKRVGGWGDFGAFSFFPSKNVTVLGDGGCLCLNDEDLADRLRVLRNHGRRGKFEHLVAGYNLRFDEVKAAVGRVMLARLPGYNEARRRLADRYTARLGAELPEAVALPREHPAARSAWHLYVIRTPRRDDLRAWLAARGVETGLHYPIPNHRQPAVLAKFPDQPPLPRTERLVDEILSLPLFPGMTDDELSSVCDAIVAFHRV